MTPERAVVYCCECGKRSDRGCIARCRACSGLDEKFISGYPNTCENCKQKIPDDQWMCSKCATVFDGDRFHNELLEDKP